ncbi:MAG: peptidase S41 [Bdellovibrionales bacterium CG10_big_fil_rev_8_21_14_0_10_45_34]|nr:MAG: peptidase S41 [Bdellovibrionales bacterium CG10_big_fil_rev_8_21_14_0_10_45_34]
MQIKLSRRLAFSAVGLSSIVLLGLNQDDLKVRYEKLQIFAKALSLIEQHYVEPVKAEKLLYGGIAGMLEELDPHSHFLPPESFKGLEDETSGEFGGIGIEIAIQEKTPTIIAPIEDTPAFKAGIKPGDKIIKVNGELTKGWSLTRLGEKLKGKQGVAVTLTLGREGIEAPFDIRIVRDRIRIASVKPTDLGEGILLIRVTSFIDQTAKNLRDAIEKFQNGKLSGPSIHKMRLGKSDTGSPSREVSSKSEKEVKVRALLLDLRNNPGGLLDQAIEVSDLFLESGPIVSTVGRSDRQVAFAQKENTYSNFPIVVLINEYSASASEIVAGALKDGKRAVLLGQRSFGKGSVQSVVKLGDGSGMKLTVARYFTPSGRSIQAEGIVPDIWVEQYDPKVLKEAKQKRLAIRERDIAGHLLGDRESKRADEAKDTDSTLELDENVFSEKSPFAQDYQLIQAVNYARALTSIKL